MDEPAQSRTSVEDATKRLPSASCYASGDPKYEAFVEEMAKHCRCTPACNRPCDGVLAGGLCDGIEWDREYDWEDA